MSKLKYSLRIDEFKLNCEVSLKNKKSHLEETTSFK
jgi:hypothetical protein